MRVTNTFSPQFIEGFVKQCQQMGLNADQTEDLFRKHANNTIMAQPNIFDGFSRTLGKYTGPMSKSAMTRWLTPDIIALAEECRVKWGSDALSQQMRQDMQWPEPSWETVPEELQKVAHSLSHSLAEFDYLPLNQKVMLAALLGSGIGGLKRTVAPSDEDAMMHRGALSRFTHGAGHGAAVGAGAGLGAGVGEEFFGDHKNLGHGASVESHSLPGMLLGAGMGGAGVSHLLGD
jgi:hypothetical protein